MKELVLVGNDGKEYKYEIIVSFHMTKTGKDYVVYTDNVRNENGALNIYALIYYPEDESKFEEVKTDEEWKEISKVLDKLRNQAWGE